MRHREDPPPAGTQHPRDLPHHRGGVGHERHRAVRRAGQVEARVGERQPLGVGLHQGVTGCRCARRASARTRAAPRTGRSRPAWRPRAPASGCTGLLRRRPPAPAGRPRRRAGARRPRGPVPGTTGSRRRRGSPPCSAWYSRAALSHHCREARSVSSWPAGRRTALMITGSTPLTASIRLAWSRCGVPAVHPSTSVRTSESLLHDHCSRRPERHDPKTYAQVAINDIGIRRGLPRRDRRHHQVLQRRRHRRGHHRQGRPRRGPPRHRLQDRGRHPLPRAVHQARRRPQRGRLRRRRRSRPWFSRRRTRRVG